MHFLCVASFAACRNQIIPCHIHKGCFFSPFDTSCSCSVHLKGKTAFSQSQSQHCGSQLLLFYSHTITIFMRSPADGKTISLCPLPFSFVALILFCGLILMKWVTLNQAFSGVVISTTW